MWNSDQFKKKLFVIIQIVTRNQSVFKKLILILISCFSKLELNIYNAIKIIIRLLCTYSIKIKKNLSENMYNEITALYA